MRRRASAAGRIPAGQRPWRARPETGTCTAATGGAALAAWDVLAVTAGPGAPGAGAHGRQDGQLTGLARIAD